MACQDLLVVALVFITVVGAFATDKSPLPTPSEASSPTKLLSSSSSASSIKSSFDGKAPKPSSVGAPKSFSSTFSSNHSKSDSLETKKGSSFDAESLEDVSSPHSPNVIDKFFTLLQALKSKDDAVDSESLNSNNDSPTPAPFNFNATEVIIGITNIIVVTRFFLF